MGESLPFIILLKQVPTPNFRFPTPTQQWGKPRYHFEKMQINESDFWAFVIERWSLYTALEMESVAWLQN